MTKAEQETERERRADRLAQQFHEAYERLAPAFGYTTRKESAKPWSEVPENNRKLMTAVCAEIFAADPLREELVQALEMALAFFYSPTSFNPVEVERRYEVVLAKAKAGQP